MRIYQKAALLLALLWAAGCSRPTPPQPPTEPPKPETPGVVHATVKPLPEPAPAAPFAFAFTDAAHGWAAAGTAILTTADGGRTWAKLATLASPAAQLDFVSAEQGWAVTKQGLLVTHDGGRTWADAGRPAADRVDFADAAHGWVHEGSALFATADGGQTWSAVKDPCDGSDEFGFYLSFPTVQTGWVACGWQPATAMQPKAVYRTDDGGQSWDLMAATGIPTEFKGKQGTIPMGGHLSSLFFLDAQHGWMGESRGVLLATADGGRTWQAVPGPMGTVEQFIAGIRFVSARDGFVLDQSILYVTHDGGSSFTPVLPSLAPESSLPAQALDAKTWVAAGTRLDRSAILWTEDAGQTWRKVGAISGEGVGAIRFVDRQHGWAVGSHWAGSSSAQTLYATLDGGATWTAVHQGPTDGQQQFAAISVLDAQTLIGASGTGQLFLSGDGGASFTPMGGPQAPSTAPTFISLTKGWRIRDFVLEATADGGKSWAPAGLNSRVVGFDLLPDGSGWVIGGQMVNGTAQFELWFTPDWGKGWTRFDLGALQPGAVRCADRATCLIGASDGLYETMDGGHIWVQVR
jgi:photosystem II stability/assembly factor-like uncharacterized protein